MTQKPSGLFGKKSPQFYAELRERPVLVAVSSGKVFRGTLVGVDVYDIVLRQESGLELLIGKGQIVYVHKG